MVGAVNGVTSGYGFSLKPATSSCLTGRIRRKEPGRPDEIFPFLYVQKYVGGGRAWELAGPIAKYADSFAALPDEVPLLVWGGLTTPVDLATVSGRNGWRLASCIDTL